jgi:hypothetical protein
MSLIRDLVERFGLSARDVIRLIESAPARYKIYDIPKRRGGRRTIAQPSKELKRIQRFIVGQKVESFSGSRNGYGSRGETQHFCECSGASREGADT